MRWLDLGIGSEPQIVSTSWPLRPMVSASQSHQAKLRVKRLRMFTGPNGTPWDNGPLLQTPLQEAKGVAHGHVDHLAALIRVVVPNSRVDAPGFQPRDGTKNLTPAGIIPSKHFFIGNSQTINGQW